MDTKDREKFGALFLSRDNDSLKTYDELEKHIHYNRDSYLDSSTEEKGKEFEIAYENIYQLNAFEKDEARTIFNDANLDFYRADDVLTITMYDAYKSNDMSILKNGLHTFNRLTYSSVLTTCNGCNHSGRFAEVVYAFADCDIELVKRLLPKVHNLADKNTHRFLRSSCNLIMGMIYQNKDWVQEAQGQANKFILQKSNSKTDIFVVKYILALSENDVDQASIYLQKIADTYRKMTWLFDFQNEFLKFFGAFVHGLYYMARFTLSENHFSQINSPKHSVFWDDFNLHTLETNFATGKSLFEWDGKYKSLSYLFNL